MPDQVAAVMAAIMRQPGRIDHLLPGPIDVAGKDSGRQRRDGGIERRAADMRHGDQFLRRPTDEDEAAERRVVAPIAARQFEEDHVTGAAVAIAPAGMLLAEAGGRADEGAEARKGAAGLDHGAVALGRDVALARAVVHRLDGRGHARIRDSCRLAHARLLARALDPAQGVDQARDVEPFGIGQRGAERFGQAMRQARRPLLDADAAGALRPRAERIDDGRGSSADAILRPRGVAQQAHHHVGRRLVVRVALEGGMADLVGDRHPLHLPRHQHHLAVLRHDQHVRHEVAPVIQAGEIKNVLGRRDQAEIEVARRHLLAHGVEAGAVLLLVEAEHHAVRRHPSTEKLLSRWISRRRE